MATTSYDFDGTITKKIDGVVQYSKTYTASQALGTALIPSPPAPSPSSPAPAPGGVAPTLNSVIAAENVSYTAPVPMTVRFVSEDDPLLFVEKDVAQGETFVCDNVYFGNDPHFNHAKHCEYRGAPSGTGTGTPIVNDIVDATGSIVTASYDAMLANGVANNDSWYAYLRGPAAASSAGGTKFFERPHTQFPGSFGGQALCKYEHGGPPEPGGGGFFSTSQTDVACAGPTSGSGVVSLQTSGYTSNVGMVSPQPQWQRNYSIEHPNLPTYRTAGTLPASGDVKATYVISSNDVSSENGTSRIVITSNGKLVTVGSNTAGNSPHSLALDAGKFPVTGCMTSKAEFAFVPVWDSATRTGQVAVIICGGLFDGAKWDDVSNPALWTTSNPATALATEDWWAEWRQMYPGLPNQGNTAFMKVLGYVPIPGMSAPTSCAATTGFHPWQMIGGITSPQGHGTPGYGMSPISAHYTELRDGGTFGGRLARGGLLMVASKSEKKVAFFDLKPLFEWVYDSYYGANHTRGERQNLGMGATQWPQTMANSGVTMPHIKTISFASTVNALKFTATQPSPITGNRPAFGWVLTGDGICHVMACGNYVPSNRTGLQGQPAEIFEKSTVAGFGSVSSVATMLGMKQTGNVDPNNGFWFVCRTTREIGFARMNTDGTGGSVAFKYTPHADQCVDPIGLADIDNYSNETNAQIVFDYNGKRISTFRTDILHHNGSWSAWPQNTPVQLTNGIPVEYYGSFTTAGKPVHGLTANVP